MAHTTLGDVVGGISEPPAENRPASQETRIVRDIRNENLAYEPDTNAFKCDACDLGRPCLARCDWKCTRQCTCS